MKGKRWQLEDLGDGHFAVHGQMTFDTAAKLLDASRSLFDDFSVLRIDFSKVTRSDSAGLALLLEWVNWSKRSVREIHFDNVPAQVRSIAQISEVEVILDAGQRWTQQPA